MLRFLNPTPLYIIDNEAELNIDWPNYTKVKCLDTGKFYRLQNFTFTEVPEIETGNITKAEIEAKLTGVITTHSHALPNPIVTALATSGTIAVPMTSADVFTIIPSGACTFTTTSFLIGKRVTFMIKTNGTTARILTWGTGFKASTTLSTGTVSGKYFTVTFICNGTYWIEMGARLAAV